MTEVRPATPPQGLSESSGQVITAAQKQALMDNLRLEVTDRARKLRAQYSVLSSSLKARLDMRINRIPTALRSTSMGELIDQYSDSLEAKPKPLAISMPQPIYSTTQQVSREDVRLASSYPARDKGVKRSSAEMLGSDKENMSVDLSVAKKRAKVDPKGPAKTTASRAVRNGSRKLNPSTVLSPKSHNSRTLPHSPLKPVPSAGGSYLARAASPSKPAITAQSISTMGPPVEKPKSSRSRVAVKVSATSTVSSVGSVRGKRGATAAGTSQASKTTRDRAASNSSASSSVSTTTVVNKKTTSTKKGIMGKVAEMATSAGRKAAVAKKQAAATTDSGKRVLRTRK